jgi:hypothetical protein
MKLTGLHLLLTYKCTFECDHCFVWGSPRQEGVMTVDDVRNILRQARDTRTIQSIYFEGGEPFLYYPILVRGVQMAASMGFHVGIVTNAVWATSVDDALLWLKPFPELIEDLSISSDLFHYDEFLSRNAKNAAAAAERLGIAIGIISVAQPGDVMSPERNAAGTTPAAQPGDVMSPERNAAGTTEPLNSVVGQLPEGESSVMYRGRAACQLVANAKLSPWETFTSCMSEDLREPGRVHLDPFGNLHICQGLVIGNIHQTPLKQICAEYDPESHPIVGPLLAGGPVALVTEYNLPHVVSYADACHLCYESRAALRARFPEVLAPDQMYGV